MNVCIFFKNIFDINGKHSQTQTFSFSSEDGEPNSDQYYVLNSYSIF